MLGSLKIDTIDHFVTGVSEHGSVPVAPRNDDALGQHIESTLAALAPSEELEPTRLAAAMRYSLLSPGKRVRVRIAALAVQDLNGPVADAIVAGCAVEMVHSASLILDDLPCMDDAERRRGAPTNHRVYGEDTAILAAIGLLGDAFKALAGLERVGAHLRTGLVASLSEAIGIMGLVGGQEMDLRAARIQVSETLVQTIHERKTGALFACAAEAGAWIVDRHAELGAPLHDFGMLAGTAFQAYDDLADVRAPSEQLGKDTGNDDGKATLVALAGVEQAEASADRQFRDAFARLEGTQLEHGALAGFVVELQGALKARIGRSDLAR